MTIYDDELTKVINTLLKTSSQDDDIIVYVKNVSSVQDNWLVQMLHVMKFTPSGITSMCYGY